MVPFIVAGVGVSMALPTTATAALSAVPPAELGKASGANNTLQRFGGAFGIAAVAAVFAAAAVWVPRRRRPWYRPAVGFSATLSLLGAVAALAVTRLRRPLPDQPAARTQPAAQQEAKALPVTG